MLYGRSKNQNLHPLNNHEFEDKEDDELVSKLAMSLLPEGFCLQLV
jgi:hypothetical protein